MNNNINWYKDQVALNVLAGSLENAKKVYDACEGHVVLGVLTKDYKDNSSCVSAMKQYQQLTENAISVGLGQGDPNQSLMVSQVAHEIQPQHVCQVFTGVAYTGATLGQKDTYIDALVSPTGKVGYVNIATGPLSSKEMVAEVPVTTAIALVKDMGGNSFKYYPMGGLKHRAEYEYICKECASHDLGIEPSGGITLENFEEILQIALNAGVKKILPHLYASIMNKKTGETNIEDIRKLLEIIKKNV